MNDKTKTQLRAEAVKRLRQFDANERVGKARLVLSMLDWTEEYDATKSVYEMRAALIDLLTDDEPQDGTTPEFDVPLYGWHEGDTREKLEADMNDLIHETVRNARECCSVTFCWDGDMFTDLLDRQAAITTQECTDVYVSGCEACRRTQKREIAELQEKVDELEATLKEERMSNFKELVSQDDRIASLEAENAELKAKLDAIREAVDE